MSKEKPKTETTVASKALPSSSGSGRIGQSAPTLEEADMLIEQLFACAVAHMTHYNRTPFSENFHPVHREIWHQTIDYQNRRMLAKATFTYVDDQNTDSVEIPESLKDIDGCVTRIMGKRMERWTKCPPPRNGQSFVACGRVTWADEGGGGSSPFVSEIYWDAGCEAWCHRKDEEVGMTVARFNDERVHIDHWIDLPNNKD